MPVVKHLNLRLVHANLIRKLLSALTLHVLFWTASGSIARCSKLNFVFKRLAVKSITWLKDAYAN